MNRSPFIPSDETLIFWHCKNERFLKFSDPFVEIFIEKSSKFSTFNRVWGNQKLKINHFFNQTSLILILELCRTKKNNIEEFRIK